VTAEGGAMMRAIHQTIDGEPKILADSISQRQVNTQSEFYKSRLELLGLTPELTRLRLKAGFVLRSRFGEDCLAETVHSGVRQYVLLGAWLETFAYRQPPWSGSLRIFEVYHPVTPQWKRNWLADANVPVPHDVTFIPVDFEKISVATALSQGGVNVRAAVFFSMHGVSQYLTETAIDQTLRFILSLPSPSEVVFSFVASDAVLDSHDVALASDTARFTAIGEPRFLRFLPDQLEPKLTAIGFVRVSVSPRRRPMNATLKAAATV
jgi:methyltransferase (TIGR00027 family)